MRSILVALIGASVAPRALLLRYTLPMARTKKQPGTPEEYAAFSNVLKQVLSVSHSELQARLEAEKKEKAARKSAAVSRDSDEQT